MINPSRSLRIGHMLLLVLLSCVMLAPLAWMLSTSLKTFDEVLQVPPVFFPEAPAWENYRHVLGEVPLLLQAQNSLLVAVLATMGTLVSSSLAGYAFAHIRVRYADWIFVGLMASLFLPAQVVIIPLFKVFAWLGWVDTFLPLIVPAWLGVQVFSIFLMRQAFLSVPRELLDAARCDGANEGVAFVRVALPLCMPAVMVVGVFAFIGSWNDLWNPLVYLHSEDRHTLPVGLLAFMSVVAVPEATPWHWIMAFCTLTILPVVVAFYAVQRRLLRVVAFADAGQADV